MFFRPAHFLPAPAPALLLALLIGLQAASAHAFEFFEHRNLTNTVLDKLCSSKPRANKVCAARKALLKVVHRRDARLTVGDFAAMAGDHSVSPPSLVWRFFIAQPGTFYLPNLNVLHGESPENVEQAALDVSKFLDVVLNLQPSTSAPDDWRQCAHDAKQRYDKVMMGSAASFLSAAKSGDLKSFSGLAKAKLSSFRLLPVPPVDPNYIANAAHNASHFRIPAGLSSEQLWARTYYRLRDDPFGRVSRSKPALHALSYYGDLHGGALILMRAAGRTATRQRRRALQASALLLELFSLHFLQDAVAAGHLGGEAQHHLGYPAVFLKHDSARVASAGSILDFSKRKSLHDGGNAEGRRVILSVKAGRAVCNVARRRGPRRLELKGAARLQRIFGDGALLCGKAKHHPWLTQALFGAVTRRSLQELERAFGDSLLDEAAPTLLNDADGFRAVTPCDIGANAEESASPIGTLHNLTCQWWESHPEKKFEKAIALRRVFAAGYYDALHLLPLPAHDDGEREAEQHHRREGVTEAEFCRSRGYR